jgi:hypothetical protein
MKRLTNFLALIVLVVGCDKVRPMPKYSWGYLEADVNGKQWGNLYKNAYQAVVAQIGQTGNLLPCKEKALSISSYLYNNDMYQRKLLTFYNLSLKKGRYSIVAFDRNSCMVSDTIYSDLNLLGDDGDVFAGYYNVLETENNYLLIDEYNPKTKEIKGQFQLTLVFGGEDNQTQWRDTLRFTNGKFHTKLLAP